MKLIAKVTLVTRAGEIQPGDEIEIKDKAEAARLIERGFAEAPAVKAEAAEEGGSGDGGEG
jgi:hypothetical protein